MRNLRPLGDKILVEIQEIKQTESGLYIPDSAVSDRSTRLAVVIAVGPGLPSQDGCSKGPSVKVGDRVLLSKYGGTDCSDNLLILREDEILGVF